MYVSYSTWLDELNVETKGYGICGSNGIPWTYESDEL